MHRFTAHPKFCCFGLGALVSGLLVVGSGFAANTGGSSTAANSYQQQRADCLAGKTAEDQTTCLREAGAARQAAQRGDLRNGADYQRNALQRCQPLPPEDKADCERRVRGEGSASGSVGGGGIYRELRTTIPAPDSESR